MKGLNQNENEENLRTQSFIFNTESTLCCLRESCALSDYKCNHCT
jgi:hypothetical protein